MCIRDSADSYLRTAANGSHGDALPLEVLDALYIAALGDKEMYRFRVERNKAAQILHRLALEGPFAPVCEEIKTVGENNLSLALPEQREILSRAAGGLGVRLHPGNT